MSSISTDADRYIGFAAMVVGMFMAILDVQIVASSLNDIQSGLSASPEEVSWVQTSYLIAEVIVIPLSALLTRILSTRILFALSSAGFTIASAMCSASWSIDSMIVFRCLQGFIGGAMIPVVFASAFTVFPASQRNVISVVIGLVATAAPTLGPTLGGWITYTSSWHWLFLINIVPGVFVTLIVCRFVKFDSPNLSLLKRFDIIGFALMATFLGCLQYIAEEGPRRSWLEDAHIRIGLISMVMAAIAFACWVYHRLDPVVELRAFQDRNFLLGCIFSFVIGIGLYGSVYLLPLFLGRVRAYSALDIGLVMMIAGVFQFLSAPVAGRLSGVMEPRLMLACGLVLFACGVYMQTSVSAEWGFWEFFLPLAVRGSALMFLFIPVNALALGTLPSSRVANASGLYNLMRNLGGAIGIALINTIMTNRHAVHWSHLAEEVRSTNLLVQRYLDASQSQLDPYLIEAASDGAMKQIAQIVEREAQVLTIADIQLLMSILFICTLLLLPLMKVGSSATAPAR